MKTYKVWHKQINYGTTRGVVVQAWNKKEALVKSCYIEKVVAIGGKLKDIHITKQ